MQVKTQQILLYGESRVKDNMFRPISIIRSNVVTK